MKKVKLLQLAVVTVMGLGLTGGIASAGVITDIVETGPDSTVDVTVEQENDVTLTNNNDTVAEVTNDQEATSGDTIVRHNTTGGDATSGDSTTSFDVVADVDHTNASSSDFALNSGGAGDMDVDTTIENTGPDSEITIEATYTNTVEVENNNTFEIVVDNTQSSTTGDARVAGNTTGGDATSGDAEATASVDISHFTSN